MTPPTLHIQRDLYWTERDWPTWVLACATRSSSPQYLHQQIDFLLRLRNG